MAKFIDGLTDAFREGDVGAEGKLLEADNVRRLQEMYRAIARGDFAAATGVMTGDVELQIFGAAGFDFVKKARGPEQMLTALQTNFAQLEDQRPELLTLVAQGNTVVVIGRERGRHRPTGKPYDLHWVLQFEFRDGKISRVREFTDKSAPASD
jgi:ketosteroid isomerase-like protein